MCGTWRGKRACHCADCSEGKVYVQGLGAIHVTPACSFGDHLFYCEFPNELVFASVCHFQWFAVAYFNIPQRELVVMFKRWMVTDWRIEVCRAELKIVFHVGILSGVKLEASSDLLIGQWEHSPRIVALVDAYVTQAQQIRDSIDELRIGRTLDRAVGVWLDWIGDRVGLRRPYTPNPTIDPRFGFDDAGVGFDVVPFRGDASNDATFPLPDATYRHLLKARFVTIRSDATFRSIKRAVQYVDPGASVQDRRNKTLRIVTSRRSLLELADRIGALPVSAGVGLVFADRDRFGFDESGVGFDQGAFG